MKRITLTLALGAFSAACDPGSALLSDDVKAASAALTLPDVAFTLKDQYDNEVSLDQTFKGRDVILDYCAMWCVPCQRMSASVPQVVRDLNAAGHPVSYAQILFQDFAGAPPTRRDAASWGATFDNPYSILHLEDHPEMVGEIDRQWAELGMASKEHTVACPTLAFLAWEGDRHVVKEAWVGSLRAVEVEEHMLNALGDFGATDPYPMGDPTPLGLLDFRYTYEVDLYGLAEERPDRLRFEDTGIHQVVNDAGVLGLPPWSFAEFGAENLRITDGAAAGTIYGKLYAIVIESYKSNHDLDSEESDKDLTIRLAKMSSPEAARDRVHIDRLARGFALTGNGVYSEQRRFVDLALPILPDKTPFLSRVPMGSDLKATFNLPAGKPYIAAGVGLEYVKDLKTPALQLDALIRIASGELMDAATAALRSLSPGAGGATTPTPTETACGKLADVTVAPPELLARVAAIRAELGCP